MKTKDLQQRQA
jgi:hypothetical protein